MKRALAASALVGASTCLSLGQTFRKLDNYHPFLVDMPTYSYQISDDGRYATGTVGGTGGSVRWDNQQVDLLWGVPTAFQLGGTSGGISADGQVVAGTHYEDTDHNGVIDTTTGAFWESGGVTQFGGPSGSQGQYVHDITADGNTLIGYTAWPPQGFLAVSSVFRFNRSTQTMDDIGYFGPPGTAAWIRSDATGDVIVGTGTGLSSYWTQGTGWVDIPGLLSFGYEVSDGGQYIVGTSKFGGGGFRGMIYDWQANVMTDLGTLGGYCDMFAVTPDAKFAVGTSNDLSMGHAVWWRQGIGLSSLNVDFASIIPTGWHLWEARDITPDGRYILGTAVNELGVYQSYVIDTVPEPATMIALAVPLAGLVARRRKQVR